MIGVLALWFLGIALYGVASVGLAVVICRGISRADEEASTASRTGAPADRWWT